MATDWASALVWEIGAPFYIPLRPGTGVDPASFQDYKPGGARSGQLDDDLVGGLEVDHIVVNGLAEQAPDVP